MTTFPAEAGRQVRVEEENLLINLAITSVSRLQLNSLFY